MQNYNAHVRPIDPVVGDTCHCYIGDRRYVVHRYPDHRYAAYGCYRIEFRKRTWTEVKVTEPFRKALLAAAIPAFEQVAKRKLRTGSKNWVRK